MEIKSGVLNGTLYLSLSGEFDEHAVKDARRIVDRTIDGNVPLSSVVFCLGEVSFMDSMGIGFLIGRYKKLNALGVPAYIAGVSRETDKILSMGGIYRLLPKISEQGERI